MNEPERDANRTPEEPTESGGLFSDDYEVKRENPYLRKNRQKRKAAETSMSAPTSRTEEESPSAESEPTAAPRARRTASDFLFEHVKLIAAVLTALVVISVVIITDLTGWVETIREKQEQADKTPLSMNHLRALVERDDPITWSDLSGYVRYKTNVSENSVTWHITVEGTAYEVWISGVDTALKPTYVYLYDLSTGDRMDLTKDDDLDRFLDPDQRIDPDENS